MTCWDRTVLSYLLRFPGTRDAAREWFAMQPDPVKRAVDFAGQLREDFEKVFDKACEPLPCKCAGPMSLASLTHEFVSTAFQHVNWRRVAEELLERFHPRPIRGYLCVNSVN